MISTIKPDPMITKLHPKKFVSTHCKNTFFWASALLSLLFSISLLLNVTSPGDSVWFWLARAYLSGQHLYSDLGYVQQPLYIELTAAFQFLFGESWIGVRVIGLFNAIVFIGSIWYVIKQLRIRGPMIWILFLFTYFVGIHFEAFRLDDYHVVTWSMALLTMGAGVGLLDPNNSSYAWKYAIFLGFISGVGLALRITDGAVLLLSALILIIFGMQASYQRKFIYVGLALITSTTLDISIIKITGETLSTWFSHSITGAASIKGGNTILVYPFILIQNTSLYLFHSIKDGLAVISLMLISGAAYALTRNHISKKYSEPLFIVIFAALGITLTRPNILLFVGIGILIAYSLGAILLYRFLQFKLFKNPTGLDNKLYLICIPIGLIAANSLSSGGYHFGMFFPFVTLVLSLTYIFRATLLQNRLIYCLIAILLLSITGEAAYYRYLNPYSWHSYSSPPLFKNRDLYKHPQWGYMYLDRDLLNFITPICERIGSDATGLLSLPYPFANYFCNYQPWNGYIQTFFDTSSATTINELMELLKKAPPEYIFYQQQLENLERHEKTFNNGQPLAHRKLDDLLLEKINSGQWRLDFQENYGDGSTWLLINTK